MAANVDTRHYPEQRINRRVPSGKKTKYRHHKSVNNNTYTSQWYTPPIIFEKMPGVEFSMDVAAAPEGMTPWLPARHFIRQASLEKRWSGFIWCNPPYGQQNGLTEWIDRFIAHRNGLMLLPGNIQTHWWHRLFHSTDAVLLVKGYVRFLCPSGYDKGRPLPPAVDGNGRPTFPSTIFALGETGIAALKLAQSNGLGAIVENRVEGFTLNRNLLYGGGIDVSPILGTEMANLPDHVVETLKTLVFEEYREQYLRENADLLKDVIFVKYGGQYIKDNLSVLEMPCHCKNGNGLGRRAVLKPTPLTIDLDEGRVTIVGADDLHHDDLYFSKLDSAIIDGEEIAPDQCHWSGVLVSLAQRACRKIGLNGRASIPIDVLRDCVPVHYKLGYITDNHVPLMGYGISIGYVAADKAYRSIRHAANHLGLRVDLTIHWEKRPEKPTVLVRLP